MRGTVQARGKSLAVSLFSAENKTYEAQRKASNHGRSRRETRGTPRPGVVEIFSGRKSRKAAKDQAVHFLREEERARQVFKIFSSSSGSSPRPSRPIAAITSVSLVNPRIIRIVSNRSLCNLRASALVGRLPRRDSSAISSRISSSLVPFAMAEARNNTVPSLTNQLYLFANRAMRLTGPKSALYTVDSRWARNSARRASSHSACSAGAKLGCPPEFPKSANLPGRCRPSCGRKNNEQRQSHTTPPRHGHPA